MTAEAGDGRVRIDRWSTTYLLPGDHPDPARVRWMLDGVLRRSLAASCRSLLEQAYRPDDPSVWCIRHLEVEVTLSLDALEEGRLARSWAKQFVGAIVRTLTSGPDGETVLYFPNRAAYLARFLVDAVHGRAWSKWYYAHFDALRSLPDHAALREALLREPDLLEAALLQLVELRELETVLAALRTGDVDALLGVWPGSEPFDGPASELREWLDTILALWRTAALPGHDAASRGKNVLRLLVAARRARNVPLPAGLGMAIQHLLGYAELLRPLPDPTPLAEMLAAGEVGRATDWARRSGAAAALESLPFIAQAADGDAVWLAELARTVRPTAASGRREGETPGVQAFLSSFGSLFLLLPSWLELGLPAILGKAYGEQESGPPAETNARHGSADREEDAAQVWRFLLAWKCLGRDRMVDSRYDPALALAAGLDEDWSPATLERNAATVPIASHRRMQQDLLNRLAAQGYLQGLCLRVERIALACGEEALLIRDGARDVFAYLGLLGADTVMSHFERGLDRIAQATGQEAECILFGPGMDTSTGEELIRVWQAHGMSLRRGDRPVAPARRCDGESIRPPQAADAPVTLWTAGTDERLAELIRTQAARFLFAARPAAPELDYFTLDPALCALDRDVDLTWTLVAHAALRALSRRLSGFENSSPEYLYQRFLAGMSAVRVAGDEIVVQLPNSPLRLLLHLAGVNGQSYTLPWRNHPQITLKLPD